MGRLACAGGVAAVALCVAACAGDPAQSVQTPRAPGPGAPTQPASNTETESSPIEADAATPVQDDAQPVAPGQDAPVLVRLVPDADQDDLPCENVRVPFNFDAQIPADAQLDVERAFWLMWLSERAFYSETSEVREELASVGFGRLEHIDEASGLQLFIAGSDEAVVVAFRGSEELSDWLGNINFPQEDGGVHGVTGRVHRGMAGPLSEAFERIVQTLAQFVDAGQPVWVTGHSLGGAQATLLAIRLARAGWNIGPLYTFANPRAGDAAFAREASATLGDRVYRVVNQRDIVPRLPPTRAAAEEAASALPLGEGTGVDTLQQLDYRHVGQMLWLPYAGGGDYRLLDPDGDTEDEDYWRTTAQGGTFEALFRQGDQGRRHARQRYLCRLNELRKPAWDGAQVPADTDALEELAAQENWALRATRMVEAWQRVRGVGREPGEGVLIAHPDTGISEHPELGDHPSAPSPIAWDLAWDFADNDLDPFHNFGAVGRVPAHGHGTETASVIVSPLGCPEGTSGPCVTGAAPAARLMPLRVAESVVLLGGNNTAAAVRHAVDNGAHVISISMGGVTGMAELREAVQRALDAGIIVVAAAGNNLFVVEPCSMPGVVCVAGAAPGPVPWTGSSSGDRVDLSAPATEVRYARTTRDDFGHLQFDMALASGTSDATALTAAAAALWLSYHGRDRLLARYGEAALAATFRQLLVESGVQRPSNWPVDTHGAGVLDAAALLDAPLP